MEAKASDAVSITDEELAGTLIALEAHCLGHAWHAARDELDDECRRVLSLIASEPMNNSAWFFGRNVAEVQVSALDPSPRPIKFREWF